MTPEQVAAVKAGRGVARLRDPETDQLYLLIEQGEEPTLSEDYIRKQIDEGLAAIERGECVPWDPERLKNDLRRRFAAKNSKSE